MENQTLGKRLALASIALMLISLFLFYTQLIADIGMFTETLLFLFMSVVGILLAAYSGKLSKQSKLFIVGVAGNSFMLMISSFLLIISIIIESQ
ncbi:hypothetical protein [Alkalicoccobacillus murimartini]|uniref:Membrane protein YGL010W n=1 Tax=Alkalicoccobacillus murimartini TaxID=171685 RepID=A0ABT9YL73_9BACI|nr:hypothetical protein [Alkalicoccobacillus murimartini]MDQ0208389.1 putative membrane protein YGL010W [Alkalicoccobacillus murimartini]